MTNENLMIVCISTSTEGIFLHWVLQFLDYTSILLPLLVTEYFDSMILVLLHQWRIWTLILPLHNAGELSDTYVLAGASTCPRFNRVKQHRLVVRHVLPLWLKDGNTAEPPVVCPTRNNNAHVTVSFHNNYNSYGWSL